jgi:integrase
MQQSKEKIKNKLRRTPTMPKSKLPIGVTDVPNRPNLYQFRVMLHGKRHSEHYKLPENTPARSRNSTLQKEYDRFRERCENGMNKGKITDKTTLETAYEWYVKQKQATGKLRDSTLLTTNNHFRLYILPRFGHLPLKAITTAMVTEFFADLCREGGIKTMYTAKPSLVDKINTKGSIKQIAADIGISRQALYDVRDCKCKQTKTTAQKIADYFSVPLNKAFSKEEIRSPLAPSTVERIYTSFSGLFAACMKQDIIGKNPCTNAERPTIEESTAVFLDDVQLPVFLDELQTVKRDNVRIGLTLCLRLGLRSGESRGLQWCNVDFDSGYVHIRTAINRTERGLELGKPKTKRSIRDIPLSPELKLILTEHKNQQSAHKQMLGTAWTNNDLVCPNDTGGFLDGTALSDTVKQIAANCSELPNGLHPHSLRHTFATLLIASGVNLVQTAALLGDTVNTLTRTYAHAIKSQELQAMQGVTALFDKPQALLT